MSDHTVFAWHFNIENAHDFIDAMRVRVTRDLSKSQLLFLHPPNTESVDYRPGHYIRGFAHNVLTVVAPKPPALQLLAELPKGSFVNYIEVARNFICDEQTKWGMRDLFDMHFVHPWHGKHVQVREENGSYTSQEEAKRNFVWYADEPCKLTGELDCFHLEGRHTGARRVRKLGVYHPRDLLTFDFGAYWLKHLDLRDVNRQRFGRYMRNRRSGSRSHQPLLTQCGGYFYDEDEALGRIVFRVLSVHPEQHCRSIQRFIDQYGTGPFLHPLYIDVNVSLCPMFLHPILAQEFLAFLPHSVHSHDKTTVYQHSQSVPTPFFNPVLSDVAPPCFPTVRKSENQGLVSSVSRPSFLRVHPDGQKNPGTSFFCAKGRRP